LLEEIIFDKHIPTLYFQLVAKRVFVFMFFFSVARIKIRKFANAKEGNELDEIEIQRQILNGKSCIFPKGKES